MHRKVAQHYLSTRTAVKGKKSLLEIVTVNSSIHKIKVVITSCKFLYIILVSGMNFV